MWKCPVCDQENNAATVCPTCGYDRTCDYEQYPTAFAVKRATPTHTLRRQWQAKQNPPVKPQPWPTVAPAAAPVRKKSGLWAVIIAIAVVAIVIAVANREKPAENTTLVQFCEPSGDDASRVEIQWGSETLSSEAVKEAQKLMDDNSCRNLRIVESIVDTASMKKLGKLTSAETIQFVNC